MYCISFITSTYVYIYIYLVYIFIHTYIDNRCAQTQTVGAGPGAHRHSAGSMDWAADAKRRKSSIFMVSFGEEKTKFEVKDKLSKLFQLRKLEQIAGCRIQAARCIQSIFQMCFVWKPLPKLEKSHGCSLRSNHYNKPSVGSEQYPFSHLLILVPSHFCAPFINVFAVFFPGM